MKFGGRLHWLYLAGFKDFTGKVKKRNEGGGGKGV